jgi:hypothetical protein
MAQERSNTVDARFGKGFNRGGTGALEMIRRSAKLT